MDEFSTGNAFAGGADTGGWFVGRYVTGDPLRRTDAVEVKWGVHAKGDGNGGFTANWSSNTLAVLASGVFMLRFIDDVGDVRDVVLKNPGDYAIWGSGMPHDWEALTDCTVLTVRWPSPPDDQVVPGAQGFDDAQAQDPPGP